MYNSEAADRLSDQASLQIARDLRHDHDNDDIAQQKALAKAQFESDLHTALFYSRVEATLEAAKAAKQQSASVTKPGTGTSSGKQQT